MSKYKNPFEYEQATKLSKEDVLRYYIEDFNYSRFVSSRRNIFLVGERGTGKTMTFLYYSLPVQAQRALEKQTELDLSLVSVYIPCNTPLTHRREYELLNPLNASLASEHFVVVSIMKEVLGAIYSVPDIISQSEEDLLRTELEYALNFNLPKNISFKGALDLALDRASVSVQESLNSNEDDIKKSFLSFNSGLKVFLACLRQLAKLKNSHFSLMIDDAQLFNPYQIRALNSWIAYRDNALFSFKVATTRVEAPSLETSSGGSILEGHDFTRIEMEQPYQNKTSAFGKLAWSIVQSRLDSVNIKKTPEEFFPESLAFTKDLEKARVKAHADAWKKYPDGTPKQIADYVYKYTRAIYFQERSPRANLPPYSGFDLLTHLSTGVIRNLLNPCYHMYDRMLSEIQSQQGKKTVKIDQIPPNIQTEVILQLSTEKWEWMVHKLDNSIEGCSREVAKRVYQLIDNLAILFKKRLRSKISEPRAVEFTISGFDEKKYADLQAILLIALKAQLIYTYWSSAKDSGKREPYYMPNKMLWPDRGLDPHGQHARVSITAHNLRNAAVKNIEIPFLGDVQDEPDLFTSTY